MSGLCKDCKWWYLQETVSSWGECKRVEDRKASAGYKNGTLAFVEGPMGVDVQPLITQASFGCVQFEAND